jgi:hypothetical protein
MTKLLTVATVLVALAALSAPSFTLNAEAKTCKAGKMLNPDTGKCVTKRGS